MWYADSQGLPAVAPLYDISTIFYFADKPDPQPINAAVGLVVHLTLAAAFGAVLAALAPLAKGAGRLMGFGAAAVGAAGRDARGDRLLRAPSASSAQRDNRDHRRLGPHGDQPGRRAPGWRRDHNYLCAMCPELHGAVRRLQRRTPPWPPAAILDDTVAERSHPFGS